MFSPRLNKKTFIPSWLDLMFILAPFVLMAQEAFHNHGNLRFHKNALVGFHINLTNDGAFSENQGLAGFYGVTSLEVAGTSTPVFEDMEVLVENGLYLSNSVQLTGNVNFILGNVLTERNVPTNGINFKDDAFYVGAGNTSHINGYASVTNKELFTFPVGYGNRLRNLTIASIQANDLSRCAYFFEDTNNPLSLTQQFDTSIKTSEQLRISEVEFWVIESELASVVTFSWNQESLASLLADEARKLVVAGWSRTRNQWENLGNSAITGNLEMGSITSELFVPNDYEIVTLGGNKNPSQNSNSNNYIVTPNNDGINDFLEIEDAVNSPNNILNIYNRYGNLVYSKINYNNEFDGISNGNMVIKRNKGLPSGVYYYFLSLQDTDQKVQGYVYLANN